MTQGTEAHLADAQTRIASAASTEDLRAIEREFTGKDGVVASMLAAIPTLPPEQRKDAGQSANRLKSLSSRPLPRVRPSSRTRRSRPSGRPTASTRPFRRRASTGGRCTP